MGRGRHRKLKAKGKRIAERKKERKNNRRFSPNKHLNYRIHQIEGYRPKGEKGNMVVRKALKHLRSNWPELLTKQAGGTGAKEIRRQ